MMLLISGGPRNLLGLDPARFGVLQTPTDVNPKSSIDRIWGGDNNCFTGFDENNFAWMLQVMEPQRESCKFIACPDVVGNHEATLALFEKWQPKIKAHNYPIGFVAQDGATADNIPWNHFDCLFIGGTTEFKLSETVLVMLENSQHLKWRHVGRVNTKRRFEHFFGLADSVDGSSFSKWPSRRFLAEKWLSDLEASHC